MENTEKGRLYLYDSSGVKIQFTIITLTVLELSLIKSSQTLVVEWCRENSSTSAFAPTICPG